MILVVNNIKLFYSEFVRTEIVWVLSFLFLSSQFLISSYNFILFFISLELFSFSSILFILLFLRFNKTLQFSLQYFFLSALGSLSILISIVIFYGVYSSFSFQTISLINLISLNDSLNFLMH